MGLITLKAVESNKYWIVDVTDTGPGLPEHARAHLFKAFQGRARVGGTGLGLAISQEVIRRHGGKIELLKSDENGTCFRTLLPKEPVSD